MDFGSIFTSSARGSCSRRPMLMAPPHRHIQMGKFRDRHLTRRIHRRARFIHHHLHRLLGQGIEHFIHKGLGLPSSGAVADRNQRHLEFLNQLFQRGSRFFPLGLGLVGKDRLVVEKLTSLVNDSDLAARAKTGGRSRSWASCPPGEPAVDPASSPQRFGWILHQPRLFFSAMTVFTSEVFISRAKAS